MIEINPARIIFSQNNGMVSGHLLHCVYRDSTLLIQLIQGADFPLLTHGNELLENLSRTLRVIHSPVVMLQGNAHRLCNGIQLKTV